MRYLLMLVSSIALLTYSIFNISNVENVFSPIALGIGVTLMIIVFIAKVLKDNQWEYPLMFIFVMFGLGGVMLTRFSPAFFVVASTSFAMTLMIAILIKVVYENEKKKSMHSA